MLASRKNSLFVDFVEGQTIEKYFLEIERWDIRMHSLYCLTFRMFMVINKLDMKNVKAKDKWFEKYFLEIVMSTLSDTSCFSYPLVFFELENFCRAPYTWPHFSAISVSLEAITFFRDRRHIQNLENTDELKYLMEKSNKNERRTDFQISSTLLT